MNNRFVQNIDDLIHAKARLGIMSMVMIYDKCDFMMLKKQLGLTDGNLGSHIKRLEDADYIQVTKTFEQRKPKTYITVTEKGAKAYETYINTLESIIHPQRKKDN